MVGKKSAFKKSLSEIIIDMKKLYTFKDISAVLCFPDPVLVFGGGISGMLFKNLTEIEGIIVADH